jgi:hypothetical protein
MLCCCGWCRKEASAAAKNGSQCASGVARMSATRTICGSMDAEPCCCGAPKPCSTQHCGLGVFRSTIDTAWSASSSSSRVCGFSWDSAWESACCAACRHSCDIDVSKITANIGGGCSCGAGWRHAAADVYANTVVVAESSLTCMQHVHRCTGEDVT